MKKKSLAWLIIASIILQTSSTPLLAYADTSIPIETQTIANNDSTELSTIDDNISTEEISTVVENTTEESSTTEEVSETNTESTESTENTESTKDNTEDNTEDVIDENLNEEKESISETADKEEIETQSIEDKNEISVFQDENNSYVYNINSIEDWNTLCNAQESKFTYSNGYFVVLEDCDKDITLNISCDLEIGTVYFVKDNNATKNVYLAGTGSISNSKIYYMYNSNITCNLTNTSILVNNASLNITNTVNNNIKIGSLNSNDDNIITFNNSSIINSDMSLSGAPINVTFNDITFENTNIDINATNVYFNNCNINQSTDIDTFINVKNASNSETNITFEKCNINAEHYTTGFISSNSNMNTNINFIDGEISNNTHSLTCSKNSSQKFVITSNGTNYTNCNNSIYSSENGPYPIIKDISNSTITASKDIKDQNLYAIRTICGSYNNGIDLTINNVNVSGFYNGISFENSILNSINIDNVHIDCIGEGLIFQRGSLYEDKQSNLNNITISNAKIGLSFMDEQTYNTTYPIMITNITLENVQKGIELSNFSHYKLDTATITGQGFSTQDSYAIGISGSDYTNVENIDTISNITASNFYYGISNDHGSGICRVTDSDFTDVYCGAYTKSVSFLFERCNFESTKEQSDNIPILSNGYSSNFSTNTIKSCKEFTGKRDATIGIIAPTSSEYMIDCTIKGFDLGYSCNGGSGTIVGCTIDANYAVAYAYCSWFSGCKFITGKYGFIDSTSPYDVIDCQFYGPGKEVKGSTAVERAAAVLTIIDKEEYEYLTGKDLYGDSVDFTPIAYPTVYNKEITNYCFKTTTRPAVPENITDNNSNEYKTTGSVIANFDLGCNFDYNYRIGGYKIYNCNTGIYNNKIGGYSQYDGGNDIFDCDLGILIGRMDTSNAPKKKIVRSNIIRNCNIGIKSGDNTFISDSEENYEVPLFDINNCKDGLILTKFAVSNRYETGQTEVAFYVHNNIRGITTESNNYDNIRLSIKAYNNDEYNIKFINTNSPNSNITDINNYFSGSLGVITLPNISFAKVDQAKLNISSIKAKTNKDTIEITDTTNVYAVLDKNKPKDVSVIIKGDTILGMTGNSFNVDKGIYKLIDNGLIALEGNAHPESTMYIDFDEYKEGRIVVKTSSYINEPSYYQDIQDPVDSFECVKDGWILSRVDSKDNKLINYVLQKGAVVTYDYNDGSGKVERHSYVKGSKIDFSITHNRDNSTFIGWGISPDSTEPVTDATIDEQNITYYAIYKDINSNEYLSAYPATNFEVDWSIDNSNLATIDESGKLTAKARGIVKVTATSKEDKTKSASVDINITGTKVTYDYKTNGGTSIDTDSEVFYKKGKLVDLSPIANKEGYNFVGWNTNKNATVALDTYITDENDVVLYAIYKKENVINIHTWDSIDDWTEKVTFYNNENLTKLSITNKHTNLPKEYEFIGYSLYNNVSTIINPDSVIPISLDTKDIYCMYKLNGKLIYLDTNGNELDSDSVEKIYIADNVNHHIFSYILKNAAEKAGYTFLGWKDSTNIYKEGSNFTTSDFLHSLEATYEQIKATSISISPKESTIKPKETIQLTATILPEDTLDKTVTWTSSNSEIASVDNNGLVTAYKDGEVIITATTNDGSNLSDTAVVKVISDYVITFDYQTNGGNSFSESTNTIISHPNETITLNDYSAIKDNWTFVGWNTDKNAKDSLETITVEDNITLYAIYKKDCTVTYHTYDDELNYTDHVTLYNNDTSKTLDLLSYDIDTNTYKFIGYSDNRESTNILENSSIEVNDNIDLYCIYEVSSNLTYYIKNNNDITVYEQDNISVVANSTDIIDSSFNYQLKELPKYDNYNVIGWITKDKLNSYTSDDLLSNEYTTDSMNDELYCILEKIEPEVESLMVTPKKSNIAIDETVTLKATIDSSKTYTIIWTSSDPTIATVDSNGVVTAIKCGKVTIKAQAKENNNLYDTAEVNVYNIVDPPKYNRTISLTGNIKYSDNTPYANCTIIVNVHNEAGVLGLKTVTDKNGNYTINNIVSGNAYITINDENGTLLANGTMNIDSNESGELDSIIGKGTDSNTTVSTSISDNVFNMSLTIKKESIPIATPTDTPKTNNPKTGDNNNLYLLFGILFVSISFIFTNLKIFKKKEDNE